MLIEGSFVQYDRIVRQQVRINSQTIEELGSHLGNPDLVFPETSYIFPGFIDIHVHAREDRTGKHCYKEDFKSATEAALNGGVVAIMDMPNNPCPPANDEEYLFKKNLISTKTKMDIIPYAAVGINTQPLRTHVPYKVYLGPSVGPFLFSAQDQLDQVLSKYKGKSVSFHCEDAEILKEHSTLSLHHQKRPASAEVKAVKEAISFGEKYGLKVILTHLSVKEAVELGLEAKAKGMNVALEVAPHHLYFSKDEETTQLQVNPPLRAVENRDFLLQMVKEGRIDYFATDHAPHTLEEKMKGSSGLTHLDTFGLFLSWLIKEKNVDPIILGKMASRNPGQFLNQFCERQYGEIKKGYESVFAVMDFSKETLVDSTFLKTKNKGSPFLGMTFPSQVSILHHPQRSFLYES